MKGFLKTLKSLVFPPRCGGCHALLPTAIGKDAPLFCKECAKEWEREMALQCPKCFAAYPECHCQVSALKKSGSQALIKLAPYREEGAHLVRALILDAKKSPRRRVSDFLASELKIELCKMLEKEKCAQTGVVITHIPRDSAARRRYGTDQSEALARALSVYTGIPHLPLLQRVKRTKTQKQLSAKQRMINLVGAFSVNEVPKDKCVILVDDVVTTGATTAVAVSLLRAAGAAQVITLCVAVTEKKRDGA